MNSKDMWTIKTKGWLIIEILLTSIFQENNNIPGVEMISPRLRNVFGCYKQERFNPYAAGVQFDKYKPIKKTEKWLKP